MPYSQECSRDYEKMRPQYIDGIQSPTIKIFSSLGNFKAPVVFVSDGTEQTAPQRPYQVLKYLTENSVALECQIQTVNPVDSDAVQIMRTILLNEMTTSVM